MNPLPQTTAVGPDRPKPRSLEILYWAASFILVASALAKWHLLITKQFNVGDFLGIPNVPLSWALMAGVVLELGIGGFVVSTKSRDRAFALLFLAGTFGAYRLTLLTFGIGASCSCLGSIPQLFGMGQGADNVLSSGIFASFLALVIVINWLEAKAAQREEKQAEVT
jgi:hypothetical protein